MLHPILFFSFPQFLLSLLPLSLSIGFKMSGFRRYTRISRRPMPGLLSAFWFVMTTLACPCIYSSTKGPYGHTSCGVNNVILLLLNISARRSGAANSTILIERRASANTGPWRNEPPALGICQAFARCTSPALLLPRHHLQNRGKAHNTRQYIDVRSLPYSRRCAGRYGLVNAKVEHAQSTRLTNREEGGFFFRETSSESGKILGRSADGSEVQDTTRLDRSPPSQGASSIRMPQTVACSRPVKVKGDGTDYQGPSPVTPCGVVFCANVICHNRLSLSRGNRGSHSAKARLAISRT
ncbi:hypothetical protein VTK26DRAFT_5279 [Humicola hyalothermophila]